MRAVKTNNSENDITSRELKILTKRQTYSEANYPEIKLGGLWLQRLGFRPGGTVRVTTIENELIVTLIDPGPWANENV